jgi:hypothetical protein
MGSWHVRPSGLLVPSGFGTNPKDGPGMGWGLPTTPNRRTFVGRGPAPNPDTRGWNQPELHEHVRGRAEATVAVLTGVAVLKKLDMVWGFQTVHSTGAVWQDWSGNEQNARAHRFPCNPTIGSHNIPDIPKSYRLKDALIQPLAKTDFLDLMVNHVDSRFEALGGREAAVAAVRFVLREQGQGKAVSRDVIHFAATNIAKAGYEKACSAVQAEVRQRINNENFIKLSERTQYSKDKPLAPTGNLEGVEDVIYDYAGYTALCQPRLLNAGLLAEEAKRLESLAKQD